VSGDGGVGTRYHLEATLFGVKVPTQIDVTEASRPHAMTIVAGGKLPYVGRYTFTPTAEGTIVEIRVEIKRSPWRQLAPLLSMVMRHHLRGLNRILAN
jgi:hypothetical protein